VRIIFGFLFWYVLPPSDVPATTMVFYLVLIGFLAFEF